jgi:predicted DCC family thiol-disulfide oxidoreductase YuxK
MSAIGVDLEPQPVLLFDGECALCHAVVRRLLASDRAARLHFAPLQSAAAQGYLRARGLPTEDFDSLVFVPDWKNPQGAAPLFRTDGALAAARVVGGGWRSVTWLQGLPRGFRDLGYKLVARTRYALFGQYRPRPLANPEWARRFLDQ